MIIKSHWKNAIALGLLLSSSAVLAVTPAEEEEKKCIKPKFRDFSPAAMTEVAPGSDISFHVNHLADPASIGAEAKNIKLDVDIRDRKTFYEVHAKLPPELSNSFARIGIHAKPLEGDCRGQDGWLLKIKPRDGETQASPSP